MEGYLQLLLPVLLRMIERRDVGLDMRHITLAVVLHLTEDTRYLLDNASRYTIQTFNFKTRTTRAKRRNKDDCARLFCSYEVRLYFVSREYFPPPT